MLSGEEGGENTKNQPIIFNITYTPWKLKSNATAREREKFQRERPYYEMSDGGNNIYKYMTSDRKLNGENSKSETRGMIEYFEKNTGVFNGEGVISAEELKAIQTRAKAPKNLWHGFISLNEELSYKIDSLEKCMRLVKGTFVEFFRDMGLNPKNIDLICALHKDRPHHLHIHFWFSEKESKYKYRKKQLEYRHKGKIEKSIIERMRTRLELYVTKRDEKTYHTRAEALRALKKVTIRQRFPTKEEVKKSLLFLADLIPESASFYSGKRDMEPYRKNIEECMDKLLFYDERARKSHLRFLRRIDLLSKTEGPLKKYAEEIGYEYERRRKNILLSAVKEMKEKKYIPKRRHKANDGKLKRNLAISEKKVLRLFEKFLSSFGENCEWLERDFSDRLQKIEKEMKKEREKEEEKSKEFYNER